jgi:hypothetical protein
MRTLTAVGAGLAAFSLASCAPPPKEYDYPAWGFAASFEAPPKVIDTPASADASRPHTLSVEVDRGLRDFVVFVIEAPTSTRSIDQFTDAAAPIIARTMGGEVGPMTYVATVQLTNQAMGREVQITKAGRPFAVLRVYQAGGRFYEIGASSKLGPGDPAAGAFLDSFKILGGAPASNTLGYSAAPVRSR